MFVSLTDGMKVEVLKSSLHQSGSDKIKYKRLTLRHTANNSRVECESQALVRLTVVSQVNLCALHSDAHGYRAISVCWLIWLDYYLSTLISGRERERCAG